MVRYLEREESEKARTLWEEVFTEDSSSFNDFYFSEVTKNNRILTSWEEGRMAAMLHRNPYEVMVRGKKWMADYIVGVATSPGMRHRGHMRRLIGRALRDMYEEGRQFCFLMPADRRIYEPFDFTYIFDQPQRELNRRGQRELWAMPCAEETECYEKAARFSEEWLSRRYEVYCKRDAAYMERLCREAVSDGGGMQLLYRRDGGSLAGVRAYYGGGKLRELLALPEYTEESGPDKPAIMARIVNLEKFVGAISLREEASVERAALRLRVTDPLIPENSGEYLWELDRNGSRLSRPAEGGEAGGQILGELNLTIGQMTEWLFGYCPGEEPPADIPGERGAVKALRGVYLDEIV